MGCQTPPGNQAGAIGRGSHAFAIKSSATTCAAFAIGPNCLKPLDGHNKYPG